jgi:hypothetical protein
MRGHKRRAVLPLIVYATLDIAIGSGFDALLGAGSLWRDLLYAGPSSLIEAYVVVYSLLLYADVRVRGEAFDLEVLARRVGQGALS